MGKDLIISSNRHETKVAILEDEQLVEIYFQRANEYSVAGSIHKGRVTRVLPGMQSAFVDIGLERDAFLYVSDFFDESEDYEPIERGDDKPTAAERPPTSDDVSAVVADKTKERDRKGRRARRRRSRGRGLPDSKYAADAGADSRQPAAPERAETEPAMEFLVLPGESLAKYAAPQDEPDSDAQLTEHGPHPHEHNAQEPPAEACPKPGEPSGAAQTRIGELQAAPATASEPEVEQIDSSRNAASAAHNPEPNQTAEPEAQEPSPSKPARPAGGAETLPGEAGGEDGELKERILEQLDDEVPPALDVEDEQAAPQPETDTRAPSEEVPREQNASARLRDQQPRYMHRLSRFARRRGRLDRSEQQQDKTAAPPDTTEEAPQAEQAPVSPPDKPLPSITELLKEGQEILVQVAKEPLGQKGARITSHIALPGRYVVYMPTLDHIGVSRKIARDQERQRLRQILQANRAGMPGGFIVRTAGAGRSEKEIAADMNFLFNLWIDIRRKAERKAAPALLHHDLQVVERVLRDQVTGEFSAIWVDNEDTYEQVLRFVQRFQPNLLNRVRLYTRPTPIFDAFNITQELEKALRPKVWLKSGGYIVINQTEALVAIDINTGKFVGKSNRLEDTIVKTNIEAVQEIARQMRLRDLGGIIVVDFIDMDERKNRQKVMQALEEAMRRDRAPYKILQFNDFGLVAITRKRVKQSLERTLCSPCPYCDGAGYVKSVETIISDILNEAQKVAHTLEGPDVMLRVHPDVARVLKAKGKDYLQELEEIFGRPVMVTSDPVLHHEKFDLA